jgi:hypothetical protein
MSSGSRSAATRSSGPTGPVTDNRIRVVSWDSNPQRVDLVEERGIDGVREAQFDGRGGTGAQVLDGVGDDDATLLDDGEPVDEALDFVEVMGGQEHRAPVGHGFADQMGEFVLQQRVQPGGGFIEHE